MIHRCRRRTKGFLEMAPSRQLSSLATVTYKLFKNLISDEEQQMEFPYIAFHFSETIIHSTCAIQMQIAY